MSDKRNIYEIRFSGSYLGGKAIIRAVSEKAAWSALSKKYINLEPIQKCRVKCLSEGDGVLYLDTGDY